MSTIENFNQQVELRKQREREKVIQDKKERRQRLADSFDPERQKKFAKDPKHIKSWKDLFLDQCEQNAELVRESELHTRAQKERIKKLEKLEDQTERIKELEKQLKEKDEELKKFKEQTEEETLAKLFKNLMN